MNVLTKIRLLIHVARWRAGWYRQNTRFAYTVPYNSKFMGPRDAIRACVKDGDVVALSGLAGNQRATILYYALRDLFIENGHPRDLTVMALGGIGGRGLVPGTVEELGHPGLMKRFITAHLETFKAQLKLADEGQIEIHTIPQAMIALLFDAQGRGESSITCPTGVGTFVDPRVGTGSQMANCSDQLVTVDGDQLRYEIPKIDVAIFNAPAADREGNIYVKNCAILAESREITRAAKYNGGKVIVNVGRVVDKGYDEVFVPAKDVDAIVVWRGTEQAGSIPHRRYWPMLTTNSNLPAEEGIAQVRFVNYVIGVTPRRTAVEFALARLAANVFCQHAKKGSYVNIGVGLPEEVCRILVEAGLMDDITFLVESGVLGGLPASGPLFGTAVCPERIMSSAEIFRLCYERLDVAILGVLQADSRGNVNVSKRGEGAINYVGPGGFIDLTTAASMVIFVSSWMAGAKCQLVNGQVKIAKPGKVKFVDHVDEVTFNGQEALKAGKKVLYATNVGTFQLTPRGMELINVMPGIDVERDVLPASTMEIVLPESGDVPVVDPTVVTGKGLQLSLSD